MQETGLQQQSGQLTAQQIQTLADAGVIPKGTPPAIVSVFATMCAQHGLSPFKREIYLVQYGSKYSYIVGIDGMRAKAARSGLLAGKDDVKFDLQPDGSFKTAAQLVAEKKMPTTASVTVYKLVGGLRCPFSKTVVFREYCPATPAQKWASMPFNMIEKCAEAAALRAAFADETAGLHIEEERAAIQDVTVSAPKEAAKPQLDPQLADRYFEVSDALAAMDFDAVLKFYKEFSDSELKDNLLFGGLFFEAVAAKAETVAQLNEFFTALNGNKWSKTAELKSILTTAKQNLIKHGATN